MRWNVSASCFGDLTKKETGKTIKDYIQSKIIEIAKHKIFDEHKTVNGIARNGFLNTLNILRDFPNSESGIP